MNARAPWRGRHRVPAVRRFVLRCVLLVAAVAALGVVARGWSDPPRASGPVAVPGRAGGAAARTGDAGPAEALPSQAATRRPAAPVPTTPEAMLELLSRLLPPVRMNAVAGHRDRSVILADADIARDGARNRLRVVLLPDAPADQRPAHPCTPSATGVRCATLPNGAVMRVGAGPSCRQRHVVEVERRDGTRVRLELATCDRAGGDESGPAALTPDECQLVAVDDQWARTMRPDLIEAGRRRFADLPAARDPDDPPRRRLR